VKWFLVIAGVAVVGGGGYLLYRKFSAFIPKQPKQVQTPQDTKSLLSRDLGGFGFDLGKYLGQEVGGDYGNIIGGAAGGLFSSGLSELGKEIF